MIELIRQQQLRGIETRVLVLRGADSAEDWPSLPVEPTFLGHSEFSRDVIGRYQAIHAMREYVHRERIDLVHSHLWGAATLAAAACGGDQIPHVVHIHDTNPWLYSSRLRDVLRRMITRHNLRNVTRYIAVSQDAWSYNRGPLNLANRPVQIVPNGVNTDEFFPKRDRVSRMGEHGVFRIGMVGRFTPEKRQANLIRAFAQLRNSGAPVELHLAGTGTRMDECRKLAQTLDIDDVVHFAGMINDVPGFLQKLDAFALPSDCEGMPLSVLEAMAVGLPVVATAVGGTPELIVNESTGLLIPPSDVDGLASAMRRLVFDAPLRDRLASSGLALVRERYSWSIAAEKIVDLYSQMVSQRQR
ncbi:MAG: glycosyltransferase family 4 protein [Planctomycetaceae bacterium]|nr:glycosyltransferase family 4 protein [Planctomycetaceae bacterium]